MPDTPLLMYQRRRAEAAREAAGQPTPGPGSPGRRYAEARALVREALTFPDALEAFWWYLKADAEADLILDFAASRESLRGFFAAVIGAMEAILDRSRSEGAALQRGIPRTEELTAAVAEAKQLQHSVLASWPDPERDFGDARPTLGTLGGSAGGAYLGPDEFSARLLGG
jgi:hypothetical protein